MSNPSETDLERALQLDSSGYFMRKQFDFELGDHHVDWSMIADGRAWQDSDGKLRYDWAIKREVHRIMIMAPRNHAKSTFWSVIYPLWRIAKNPNIRILLVSKSGSAARSFLRQVTMNLERNNDYREMFGNLVPQVPDSWTREEVIVNRTDLTLKDPTVAAVGAGGTILSKRADIIICDDILNKENTRTKYQRDQLREWFFEVLMPVLEPDGLVIVAGTAWNLDDLYHELFENDAYDIRLRYDAVVDERKQIALWPARFDWQKLMALKKENGTMSFNKSYRNLVQSAETAVWKREWTNEAKRKGAGRRLIARLKYENWDLGRLVIACGIDLAISKRKDADTTAFAVVGQTRDGMKLPLHLSEHQGFSMGQTEDFLFGLNQKFHPSIFMVEDNGYQAALQRDMAEYSDLPIRGYTTGGEKFDEEVGLNSLAVEFENGKWILPYDKESPETMDIVDTLIQAMLDFPNGHTADILMALWFANTGLRSLLNKPTRGRARFGTMNMRNQPR